MSMNVVLARVLQRCSDASHMPSVERGPRKTAHPQSEVQVLGLSCAMWSSGVSGDMRE